MLARLLASRDLHNFVVVANADVVFLEIVALGLTELGERFAIDA